jgi:uncharacterized protein
MEFEWDENKAAGNLRKHGVAFETAKEVFDDPLSTETIDPMSGEFGEDRFKIVGFGGSRLLTVIYTQRDDRVRLISARRATGKEHDNYRRQNARH